MKRTISILLLLLGITLFSQQTAAQKELLKRANENFELLSIHPKEVFEEALEIEKEAQKIGAKEIELRAISVQCAYYRIKNDFSNMMIVAEVMYQKAESYKIPVYQSIAKRFLFEAYLFSGLPDKAIDELQAGYKIVNSLDNKDSLVISTKANIYVSFSNYYLSKDDRENQLKYMKLSVVEHDKLKNGSYKETLKYVDYGNLAAAYSEINLDSAEYYANLSISQKKNQNISDVEFSNLIVLGNVNFERKDYDKALYYFLKADSIKDYKNHFNRDLLYENIIQIYKEKGDEKNVEIYQENRRFLKINVLENQNQSLHKVLKQNEVEIKGHNYILIGCMVAGLLIALLMIVRKNRILSKQETISRQYLEVLPNEKPRQNHSGLMGVLKENDSSFMLHFSDMYPDFSEKLLKVNPKISPSELEIAALLKMKITTKDIARYKFLAFKTVQNKKYLLRKKLNIPKDIDIYEWFDSV